MANQPAKHGRDHLPPGYAMVVQSFEDSADLLDDGSADQMRSIESSSAPTDVIHMYNWNYDSVNTVPDKTWTDICGLTGSDGYFQRVFYSSGWTTGWNMSSGNINLAVSAEYIVQGWVQFIDTATTSEQRFIAINFGSGNRHIQEYVANANSNSLLSVHLPVHSFYFGTTSTCHIDVWHDHGSAISIQGAEFSIKRIVRESAGTVETGP